MVADSLVFRQRLKGRQRRRKALQEKKGESSDVPGLEAAGVGSWG